MDRLQIQNKKLEIAAKAAKKGGNVASSLKDTVEQETKHNRTIVTEADRKAEQTVREFLSDNTKYSILGEEQGGNIKNENIYWVIDPIDGTKNYAYKQPLYGTAVALVEYNQPTIGAFYMPDLDNLFYGLKGVGSYRNTQEISVTNENSISDSYISLSGKGCGKIHPTVSENLNDRTQKLGSALAGQVWVASGWSDIGIYAALAPWDMAVGKVLVQGAGGVMKSVENRSQKWGDIKYGKVIFGNEEIVDSVLNMLPEKAENSILNSTYDY